MTPPEAAVSGSTTIAQGSTATVSIALTGRAPWTITWPATMDAPLTEQATSSPHRRLVGPAGTTTYAPQAVTDAGGCSATVAGSATITVQPPAPVAVTATAVSATGVSVAWSFYGSADRFRIYRNGVHVADATAAPFVDATAQPGTAYLYSVVAVKAETASPPSASDLATTVLFSDDPLRANIDGIAAAHVLQLRTAVNAVRAVAGLPAVSFPALAAVMRAGDVQELRGPLTEARTMLGLPLVGYGPALATGMVIRASDIMDLRRGVK